MQQPTHRTISEDFSGDWKDGESQDGCLVEKLNGPGMLTIADDHSHYKGETPWDDVLKQVRLHQAESTISNSAFPTDIVSRWMPP